MAKQRIKIKTKTRTIRKVRKSKTHTDKNGRIHCQTCGAYIGNKGKKK